MDHPVTVLYPRDPSIFRTGGQQMDTFVI